MSRLIKILHIDPDYRITYLIYRPQTSIRTSVSLQTAIDLLKKEDFDLILSEPHNKAILKREKPVNEIKPIKSDGLVKCPSAARAQLGAGQGWGCDHLNSLPMAGSPAEQKVVL